MIKFMRGLFESSKLSRNTTPKLVSILFAIVLYIYVMGEVNPEDYISKENVKVNLLNVEELQSSGLVIIDQNDYTVDLKISGKRNELKKISLDDIKITADLRGFPKGVNSVPLDVSKPANIEVNISPQQIKVRLDKIVQRQKPVEVFEKGAPAKSYVIGTKKITPEEILVEGPESKVESVTKVIGEINVDGAKATIRNSIPVRAVNNEGKDVIGVEVKTKSVNVLLPMEKLKNIDIKPVITGKPKEGYKITNIEVSPKTVTIKGKEEIIKKINEIFTKPINVEELNESLVTEVNFVKEKNIEMPYLQALPEVRIVVEKIETKEFTFKANQISVNNLNGALTTNIGELIEDIKIKISDVRSVLKDVKRSDLELIIDAQDLDEGIYILDLKLNKNHKYENIEIEPNNIEIEIYDKKDISETMNENTDDTVDDTMDNTTDNAIDDTIDEEQPTEETIDMPGN